MPIAQRAKDHAANAPPHEEHGGHVFAGRLQNFGRRLRRHQRRGCWLPCQGKQSLIQTIEKPRRAGHEEHEPVIRRQLSKPGAVMLVHSDTPLAVSLPALTPATLPIRVLARKTTTRTPPCTRRAPPTRP